MQNFKKFLEEITIKGNDGMPGEKDKNEPGYIKSVEDRAKAKFGVDERTDPRQYFARIMELVGKSQRLIAGKQVELEDFATKVIMDNYGSILDGITLDIKFAKGQNGVKNFMDDCDSETCQMPELRKVEDPELKQEVDKRKIANLITQGEAKNTKHILNMPEVKEGIKGILGDVKGEEAFAVWNEITSIADKIDWIIPIQAKSDMMENAPQGLAGACKVEWKPKEIKDKTEKELTSDEEESQTQEEEESYNEFDITVKAIGVDFPMLLHEAVKGIYELLTASGIPGNEELAKKVLMNTDTFEDEAEDFRYGPEVAADLRDFINDNSSADDYPNIREHIFGKMITMSAESFLKLMKGILMKSPDARVQVDNLINGVIKELKDYELGLALPSMNDDDNYEQPRSASVQETPKGVVDYSTMTQHQLQDEIDDALSTEDYETAMKIKPFLKESTLLIYGREIELLKESKINRA